MMRLAPLVTLAALCSAVAVPAQTVVNSSRAPVGSCAITATGAAAFIELATAIAARDTVATVRVCLVTGVPADPAASFHGEVRWDSAAAATVTIARPRVGMVIENATTPGRIIFAGASPSGFPEALALTFTLRLTRPGTMPNVSLAMRELNTVSARSLAAVAAVSGWPRNVAATRVAAKPSGTPARVTTTPATPPKIARLTPTFAPAESNEPPVLDIIGQSFAPEGNVVTFGPVVLRNITSANGGTLIRLLIPREGSVSEEAPPMQLTAGTYRVTVRTARGQSNSVDFEIR